MTDEQADSFYQTTAGVSSNCTDPANPKGACYFLRNYFKTVKENCNVLSANTDAARAKLCVSVGSNKNLMMLMHIQTLQEEMPVVLPVNIVFRIQAEQLSARITE